MGKKTATLHTGRRVSYGLNVSIAALCENFHDVGNFLHQLPSAPASVFHGQFAGYRSEYGNDSVGDCEVAEECRHKAIISAVTGRPQIVIPTQSAERWYFAATGGRDSGLDTSYTLTRMQSVPLVDDAGSGHLGGKFGRVDFTNADEIRAAIQYFMTVKLEVAAAQLLKVVGNHDGWVLASSVVAHTADHCVQVSGYGTYGEFCAAYKLTPSANISLDTQGFDLYTWETQGFISVTSFMNIVTGAFVRITDPDRGDAADWEKTALDIYARISGMPAPVTPPVVPPVIVPPHHAPTHRMAQLQEQALEAGIPAEIFLPICSKLVECHLAHPELNVSDVLDKIEPAMHYHLTAKRKSRASHNPGLTGMYAVLMFLGMLFGFCGSSYAAEKPKQVIAIVGAEWCGECRRVAHAGTPAELRDIFGYEVRLVDFDKQHDLAEKLIDQHNRNLPQFVLLDKCGDPQARLIGYQTASGVELFIHQPQADTKHPAPQPGALSKRLMRRVKWFQQ